MERTTGSGPGAPLPPTAIYVTGFFVGWWLETRLLTWAEQPWPTLAVVTGWCLVAGGVFLFAWGLATFFKVRTGIMLQRAATTVVEAPPYSWSRNPMYVSFTSIYIGLALVFGLWWPFFLLPLVVALLTVVVISREERYMRATFGAVYEDYCRRVRRWI